MSSRLEGDYTIDGSLSVTDSLYMPDGAVSNSAKVAAGAEISEAKIEHRIHALYSDAIGTAVATSGRVLYVCYSTTATILRFFAGSVVATGAATTVTVDLKKNGASVLSATFDLDNTNTAYVIEEPTGFSSTAVSDGQVLSATWTLTGANPPTGFFVGVEVKEKGV